MEEKRGRGLGVKVKVEVKLAGERNRDGMDVAASAKSLSEAHLGREEMRHRMNPFGVRAGLFTML